MKTAEKLSPEDLQRALDAAVEYAESIVVPPEPRLVADDCTPEAMSSLLAEHGSIGVVSSEGGPFEMIKGKYSDGRTDQDLWLKGYSGDPHRVDRKGRPGEYIERPRITSILTVQPDVLRALGEKRELEGRGFTQRWLYSCPQSRVGYRSVETEAIPDMVRDEYRVNVTALLNLFGITLSGDAPPLLRIRFSAEAKIRFIKYAEAVEKEMGPGGRLSKLRGWAAKLCGNTARIAAVLHLADHAPQLADGFFAGAWEIPTEISLDVVERAIRIADYFVAHAAVAHEMMDPSGEMNDARYVWGKIEQIARDHGAGDSAGTAVIPKQDLYQRVKDKLGKSARLDAALEMLEIMGRCRIRTVKGARGGPAKEMVEVNPAAMSSRGYRGEYIKDEFKAFSSSYEQEVRRTRNLSLQQPAPTTPTWDTTEAGDDVDDGGHASPWLQPWLPGFDPAQLDACMYVPCHDNHAVH